MTSIETVATNIVPLTVICEALAGARPSNQLCGSFTSRCPRRSCMTSMMRSDPLKPSQVARESSTAWTRKATASTTSQRTAPVGEAKSARMVGTMRMAAVPWAIAASTARTIVEPSGFLPPGPAMRLSLRIIVPPLLPGSPPTRRSRCPTGCGRGRRRP